MAAGKEALRDDFRAKEIMQELRQVTEPDVVDGPYGLALQWSENLISIDELEDALFRYRRLKVLIENGTFIP